jgi:hypothetical protein
MLFALFKSAVTGRTAAFVCNPECFLALLFVSCLADGPPRAGLKPEVRMRVETRAPGVLMKYRIRFGLRHPFGIFPNAAVLAFDGGDDARVWAGELARGVRGLFDLVGRSEWSSRVVFEAVLKSRGPDE